MSIDDESPTLASQEADEDAGVAYVLEEQIGFLLRLAIQRHYGIFHELMVADLTPAQFACLVKLSDDGAQSQNRLGRLIALDTATIKGVVDRLVNAGLVETSIDARDRRRNVVELTQRGRDTVTAAKTQGRQITERTLAPLTAQERERLLRLLRKLT